MFFLWNIETCLDKRPLVFKRMDLDLQKKGGFNPKCILNLSYYLTYEELDMSCVGKNVRHRIGWNVLGCFVGPNKDPCLFGEKEWGSFQSEIYC